MRTARTRDRSECSSPSLWGASAFIFSRTPNPKRHFWPYSPPLPPLKCVKLMAEPGLPPLTSTNYLSHAKAEQGHLSWCRSRCHRYCASWHFCGRRVHVHEGNMTHQSRSLRSQPRGLKMTFWLFGAHPPKVGNLIQHKSCKTSTEWLVHFWVSSHPNLFCTHSRIETKGVYTR